jgi:hypothetical protein
MKIHIHFTRSSYPLTNHTHTQALPTHYILGVATSTVTDHAKVARGKPQERFYNVDVAGFAFTWPVARRGEDQEFLEGNSLSTLSAILSEGLLIAPTFFKVNRISLGPRRWLLWPPQLGRYTGSESPRKKRGEREHLRDPAVGSSSSRKKHKLKIQESSNDSINTAFCNVPFCPVDKSARRLLPPSVLAATILACPRLGSREAYYGLGHMVGYNLTRCHYFLFCCWHRRGGL